MVSKVPTPAYEDTGNVLSGDKELYARIGQIAEEEAGKALIEEFDIPIRSGKAWVVKKGKYHNIGSGGIRLLTVARLCSMFDFRSRTTSLIPHRSTLQTLNPKWPSSRGFEHLVAP